MVAVAVALLVGTLIGLLVRPVIDMYVRWKTAELYARLGAGDPASETSLREHRT